jgi:RNA polymerase sigma-70 factor (ECF subfamily)
LIPDWNTIVHEHGPAVYRTAWRIVRDVQDAEDVTQEVLLEFFQSQPDQAGESGGLLVRMAVLRAIDHLRQRRRSVPVDALALADPGRGPEEEAIGSELVERLHDGITRLPAREAEVFCLRYFHDLSYEVIAETSSISRDAVAVALHKARSKLRAFLGQSIAEAAHE